MSLQPRRRSAIGAPREGSTPPPSTSSVAQFLEELGIENAARPAPNHEGALMVPVAERAPGRKEIPGVEPLLTVAEVCANTRIHKSTFYRLLANPHLGLEKIVLRVPGGSGGRLRIPARRFQAWLESVGRRLG